MKVFRRRNCITATPPQISIIPKITPSHYQNPQTITKTPAPTTISPLGTRIFPPSDELALPVPVAAVPVPDPPSGIIPFVTSPLKAVVSTIGTVYLAVLNDVGTVNVGEVEVEVADVEVCALTARPRRRIRERR